MSSLLRNLFIVVFVLTAVAIVVRDLSGNVGQGTTEKPRPVASTVAGDEDEDGTEDGRGELALIIELGFDPIWFGVVMVVVLEMGLISPARSC